VARKRKKRGLVFKTIIVYLGIAFTIILFLIKISLGNVGWLGVFAPVLIAFFIVFLLSVIKTVVEKI